MYFKILLLFVLIHTVGFSQVTNTKKWRKTERDSIQRASILFEEANYLMALPIYEDLYNRHSKEEYLKYCYGKCALKRSDKHEIALKLLTELYEKNKKIVDIEFDLATALHYNYKFDEALAYLGKYLEGKKNPNDMKQKSKQLMQYCINAKLFFGNPTDAKIENAGNILNTNQEEYVPVISADESIMIFTYRGKESTGGLQNSFNQPDPFGIYYEDIFQSNRDSIGWQKPFSLTNINTSTHDAAIALSADGNALFVYRDNGDDHGDIYLSKFENNQWTSPEKLRGEVNSYSWEGSCSMTADGKYLYFSSERGGGYGGKDIYRATLLTDGSWGNIVNLGDSINTSLDEDAPFIHPDGVTLFYSSKGKNSMGGYDIFQAKLNWKDSTFFNPVNMGYPINTPDDDIYYVLAANGERGYYASGKTGGQGLKDIYTVYPGYVGKKPSLYLVKGKITLDSIIVEANIKVEITDKENQVLANYTSNASTGKYLISLPAGGEFKLTYSYKDYKPVTLDVNSKTIEGYVEKIFNVSFSSVPDTIKPIVEAPKKDTVIPDVPIVKVSKPTQKPTADELLVKTDKFIPRNAIQQKIEEYSAKYGDVSAEGLIFRVQIAAYKYPKNYVYKHLAGLGDIENLLLDDGITRITIGGNFNTLMTAFEHNKKVVIAGQSDAFVTAIYKGKRVYLEQLEEMGIFVRKKPTE
jgi:tetratricopeptide (TPR) repeat protein